MLYIYDDKDNYVDTRIVTGTELQDEDYRMTLDLEKGNYHYYEEYGEEITGKYTIVPKGGDFEDIIEGQPYFGTIMRYGSDKFDDNLEIFKAAKQGKEQEKYQ